MNRLTTAKRVTVVAALCEGNSIRATVRMTGVAKNTIVKLLVELGGACTRYQGETLRNLPCKWLLCDEIWAFVSAKDKNVSTDEMGQFGIGSVWTWTCIDADTKLIPSWLVGTRDAWTAHEFMSDVASRLRGRVQFTTDGHKPYLAAVEGAFGADIDYATLTKIYGNDPDGEKRYSPAKCLGCENHAAAVALYFMYYNFARIHQTLRVTPAMEAGIADHVWSIEEIVGLLEG